MGAPVRLRGAHRHAGGAGAIAHSWRSHFALAAAAVVLLAGCTGSGASPPLEATPTARISTAPTPAPSSMAEAGTDSTYVPPDMAWLPPDEELDRLVAEAEQAYRAHWASYDAAIGTGFGDPELLEELLASADEATLEALYLQIAAIAGTGRFVEGGSQVVGIEHVALDPPAHDGAGLGVVFDTCVDTRATLKESDGTVVRELAGPEPRFLRVRLVEHADTWLVTSQTQHDESCPELLSTRD